MWQELGRTIAIPSREDGITGPIIRHILFQIKGKMRDKYLIPALRGEKRGCFAQTEPDAGSDPGGMRTTAVRDGNYYVLNGTKRSTTGAGKADFTQLMAATDRSKGSRGGISCFIVDMDTPGVSLGSRANTMMGDRPWEVMLDGVSVHESQLVGEEGKGFGLAQKWLVAGRVKHGSRALGLAERSLEMAVKYAHQRSTFGKPLAERQGTQWQLADIWMNLDVIMLLVRRAAAMVDDGEEARIEAYHCKYFADEIAFHAIDRCLQVNGGIGLTTHPPIERMWCQQRSYRITEGPGEVMRSVIARHVMKAYA